jgi:hypothetical protein
LTSIGSCFSTVDISEKHRARVIGAADLNPKARYELRA